MAPVKVLWKPHIGCLFTHQAAWTFETEDEDGGIYHCFKCNEFFYYPTKKIKFPVYR